MNFTCPYCAHHSTITNPDKYQVYSHLHLTPSTYGEIGLVADAVRCPNPDCNKLVLSVTLTSDSSSTGSWKASYRIKKWELLPESSAKVLPDYIPEAIKEDYYEACRIKSLSPKSAATLARRCLQGMIRDFWGVSKARLKDEIEAIEEKVDSETWAAIDAVRSIGNIGAHMERDVNTIVDIEPEEASLLIGLIETLIDDWYVTRQQRQERMRKVKDLASEKKTQQAS